MKKIHGIVLKSHQYLEKKWIVTLFSLEEGVCSCITRTLSKEHLRFLSLLAPCSEVELFVEERGKLPVIQEGCIIHSFSELKASLGALQVVGSMFRALLHMQLPGKPNEKLFIFLQKTLVALNNDTQNGQTILLLFLLRLLSYEGILSLEEFSLPKEDLAYLFLLSKERLFSNLKHYDQRGDLAEFVERRLYEMTR